MGAASDDFTPETNRSLLLWGATAPVIEIREHSKLSSQRFEGCEINEERGIWLSLPREKGISDQAERIRHANEALRRSRCSRSGKRFQPRQSNGDTDIRQKLAAAEQTGWESVVHEMKMRHSTRCHNGSVYGGFARLLDSAFSIGFL
jgi:hypothetical protein